ncbi:arabinanase levansucrase invertase [Raphidocelis subcapitata]|uniref:Arabinanase levansucrase invertase n=1 Tax=Raphidocelis subcapitata TaxID=307507 RepID=A0A2V0P812_9CHLO|nr:arabinanase levansucrase invertase [Raphidocelis subcapitata]|eukprot:GBF95699.1 arabinanase levansucrase invertase [Raphidocelis subcapitata]
MEGAPNASRGASYHMRPPSGWINDPNGPLLYKGAYHLFYQHVPGSATWNWGLCWGHAVSRDLVTWRHLPVALAPTAGSLDQDGCFSGCAVIDENGEPAILYTGVVRKPPGSFGPDVSPQYEFQLIARPKDPSDPDLTEWITEPFSPFLPAPAYTGRAGRAAIPPAAIAARDPSALGASAGLTGWRDPFVVATPGAGAAAAAGGDPNFYAIVGAGRRGEAGTALLYRSRSIHTGWEYCRELCSDPGCRMFECPLLLPLPPLPPRLGGGAAGAEPGALGPQEGGGAQPHLFCYSADYCANGSEYHIGGFSPSGAGGGAFDLAAAGAPEQMDLGDIFYAPNVLKDKQGRAVLWAWMQERDRPAGAHDHACCLSAPRCLWLAPADGAVGDGDARDSAAACGDAGGSNGDGGAASDCAGAGAEPANGTTSGADGGSPPHHGAPPAAPRLRLHQEPLPELSELRRRGARSRWAWRRDGAAAAAPAFAAAGAAPQAAPGRGGADGAEAASAAAAAVLAAPPPAQIAPQQITSMQIAPGLRTSHADVELEFERAPGGGGFAVVLAPLAAGGEGAAVAFDFDSGTLQVVHSTDPAVVLAAARAPLPRPRRLCGFPGEGEAPAPAAADEPAAALAGRDVDAAAAAAGAAAAPAAAAAAAATGAQQPAPRRCGGPLRWLPRGAASLRLRLLLDHSLLEVFTSTGEALSTRVYRGDAPPSPPGAAQTGGVQLLSWGAAGGGLAAAAAGGGLAAAAAWEMESMWCAADREAAGEAAGAAAASRAAAPADASPAAGGGGGGGGVWDGCGALRELVERHMQETEAAAGGNAPPEARARAHADAHACEAHAPPAAARAPPSPASAARRAPAPPPAAAAPRPPPPAPPLRPPRPLRLPHARAPSPLPSPSRWPTGLAAAPRAASEPWCCRDDCCEEREGPCGCGSASPRLPSPRVGGRDAWGDA